jgi:outer membrane translocation and assembly module TamA
MVKYLLLTACLFPLISLNAQQKTGEEKRWKKTLLAVPTLGSSPETGFYAGAVATLDLAPTKDTTARHSVYSAEIAFTAKKQFVLSGRWDITNLNRDYILFGENSWMKFPELYWGIGGKTADENELLYDAYRIEMENGLYHRFGKNLFIGLDQQLQSVYALSLPESSAEKIEILTGIKPGLASGFGLGILYDTRSNLLNPRAGEYLMMLHGLYFGKAFGSDFRFPHGHTDFRFYLPAGGKNILALQATAEVFGEGSPFRLQAMLGGNMMLRGYYQGRFRDQNQVSAQAEYRMQIWRWIGGAAFAAMGDAFSIKHPERNGRIKTAAGLGLRIRVDKKENTNLRFDYAITNDNSRGFYVSFGEAF